jgi:hypothetical protein
MRRGLALYLLASSTGGRVSMVRVCLSAAPVVRPDYLPVGSCEGEHVEEQAQRATRDLICVMSGLMGCRRAIQGRK